MPARDERMPVQPPPRAPDQHQPRIDQPVDDVVDQRAVAVRIGSIDVVEDDLPEAGAARDDAPQRGRVGTVGTRMYPVDPPCASAYCCTAHVLPDPSGAHTMRTDARRVSVNQAASRGRSIRSRAVRGRERKYGFRSSITILGRPPTG